MVSFCCFGLLDPLSILHLLLSYVVRSSIMSGRGKQGVSSGVGRGKQGDQSGAGRGRQGVSSSAGRGKQGVPSSASRGEQGVPSIAGLGKQEVCYGSGRGKSGERIGYSGAGGQSGQPLAGSSSATSGGGGGGGVGPSGIRWGCDRFSVSERV